MHRWQAAGYALVGLAIGWLLGQSETAGLTTLLGGLISLAAAANAVGPTLGFGRTEGRAQSAGLSIWYVAALAVGLAVGASTGTKAKQEYWLTPAPADVATQWERLGLEKDEVVKRLFEHQFPLGPQGKPEPQ